MTDFRRPDYVRACSAAQSLLGQFGIDSPPIDPVFIARELGAKVRFVTFNKDLAKVSGFFDAEHDVIYVNEDEYPLRQTFTVAHELGHRLLHFDWAKSTKYKVLLRDSENQDYDVHELEANVFAANLLVPTEMLSRYWPNLNEKELSRLFAVSVPAIKKRINREFGA